jgi:fumarate hydratase class II
MRQEKDALGYVMVPEDRYFGAQTQRASENFRIGNERFPVEMIRAHALVKKAAARVNNTLGSLSDELAQTIEAAADEVIAGKLDEHFPLAIWQSGSGTQFNMNVNEVIANRGIEMLGGTIGTKAPVHPNDHVNMAQSTNDTVPTSIHIAGVVAIAEKLLPEIDALAKAFADKSAEFDSVVKIGRTHLQDATPLTLGQEFSGYGAQLEQAAKAVRSSLDWLYDLCVGGTAVGTGLNTKPEYAQMMADEIAAITGHPFRTAPNKFAAMAAHDAVVNASGALKTVAAALMKIANDIRWLGSGPRSGLGELNLPANEPGSSIMPGKVNPTQCEMITQLVCQVYGNDTAIAMAGSQGNFELNVFKPLLGNSLIQSINLLADGCRSFRENCVVGIEANTKRIDEHVNNSLMLVTSLNRHIGYDKAAEIALKAWREEKTLKQAALELEYLTEDEFVDWVRPEDMTGPR